MDVEEHVLNNFLRLTMVMQDAAGRTENGPRILFEENAELVCAWGVRMVR